MDMTPTIVPKSDQKNADDLLAGPITIKITNVTIRPGTEQPISVFFDGDEGKPWKPCKSMARVLVAAWGADASKYKGRSVTLFCDPKVKWGGMEVGGIRISHMSDIESSMTMALTVTRANKKPFTVKPIVMAQPKAAQQNPEQATAGAETPSEQSSAVAAPYISDNEAFALDARCEENGIKVASLLKAAKVEKLSLILEADLPRCHAWLDAVIAKQRAA